MFVWSKRLVATLLGLFVLMLGVFFLNAAPDSTSGLKIHTTRWMALNYLGLVVWVFVWMIDQARMRGKNVWRPRVKMTSSTPSTGMNWLPMPITTTRLPSTVVSNRLRTPQF